METTNEKSNQKQTILIAAFNCLSKNGYANVSMRDIADEAKVTLSQLSYYYKNKEGLFTEVVKSTIYQYMNDVEFNIKSAESKREKIAALIKYFSELLRQKPELLKLVIDFTAQSLWMPSFRNLVNNLYNNLSELVETNIIKNNISLKDYSSGALAKLIIGALYGTSIQIMLDSEREDMESLNMIGMILNKHNFQHN